MAAVPEVASLKGAFTEAELSAFSEVATKLTASKAEGGAGLDPNEVRSREVMVVTMVSKCRPDKAVEKYGELMDVLKEYGLTIDSLHLDEAVSKKLGDRLDLCYRVCGVDNGGRHVMWIGSPKPTQVHEEQDAVHAGILYWMAVHADIETLREGCTFVIDTSKQPDVKVGNERKLQKTWQALPLRPQHLFIVGASFMKRAFINALIRFASLFSSSKVLGRVRFVDMDKVRVEVPASSMPSDLGGEERCAVRQWVAARIAAFDGIHVDGAKAHPSRATIV